MVDVIARMIKLKDAIDYRTGWIWNSFQATILGDQRSNDQSNRKRGEPEQPKCLDVKGVSKQTGLVLLVVREEGL